MTVDITPSSPDAQPTGHGTAVSGRRSRVRTRTLALSLTVACALVCVAGCSSDSPIPPPAQSASLAGTAWTGSCPTVGVGTYSFSFGPLASTPASMVRVELPDATAQTAPFRITPTTPGAGNLDVALTPPWNGSFSRDAANLVLNFRRGSSQVAQYCNLRAPGPAQLSNN